MEYPIAYCLFHPQSYQNEQHGLNFDILHNLTFQQPDEAKFPCLKLARQCLNAGGNLCAVFQASNEIAVEAFLNKKIKFTNIPNVIESTLSNYCGEKDTSLENSILTVKTARMIAKKNIF